MSETIPKVSEETLVNLFVDDFQEALKKGEKREGFLQRLDKDGDAIATQLWAGCRQQVLSKIEVKTGETWSLDKESFKEAVKKAIQVTLELDSLGGQ